MKVLAALILLACASPIFAQQFITQAFANQDFHSKEWPNLEKFGKTELEIVEMGHDKFIGWYTTPDRAGANAKTQAEVVFATALNECNAPKIKALTKQEQLFLESAMSLFADLAKTAFTTGIQGSDEPKEWTLSIAKSNTAIQWAVYEILNVQLPVEATKDVGIERLCNQAFSRAVNKHPELKTEGNRLLSLFNLTQKAFQKRPERDQNIAKKFAIQMVHMAVSGPELN